MSLFAIADTHLSFGTNKPMDSFPGWNDYTRRLSDNWKKLVGSDDTVVIAGDVSWAMNFDELYADFHYLHTLPGKKIIIKGNHDFWWNTLRKMNEFLEKNGFDSISFVHNNSTECGGLSICGSRGWFFDSPEAQDERVLQREVGRLRASLESAVCAEKLVFLHYPPVTANGVCREIVDLLCEKGVKQCYYGHLHGAAARFAFEGQQDGVSFKLISADRLSFVPLFIAK